MPARPPVTILVVLLGSVAMTFGVLSLLVVLAATDLRDISPRSPLALLVDAELPSSTPTPLSP